MSYFKKSDIIPHIKSFLEWQIRDKNHPAYARFWSRLIHEIIEYCFMSESSSWTWHGSIPEWWEISYWATHKNIKIRVFTRKPSDNYLGWDYDKEEYFTFSKLEIQKWYNISPGKIGKYICSKCGDERFFHSDSQPSICPDCNQ